MRDGDERRGWEWGWEWGVKVGQTREENLNNIMAVYMTYWT